MKAIIIIRISNEKNNFPEGLAPNSFSDQLKSTVSQDGGFIEI